MALALAYSIMYINVYTGNKKALAHKSARSVSISGRLLFILVQYPLS